MDYDSYLELVKNRRSIRNFKNDPLPEGYIEKIIDPLRYAPSGFNSQPWDCLVITKPELKERISELIGEGMREIFQKSASPGTQSKLPPPNTVMGYSKAPVFIILLGDTRVRQLSPVPHVRTDDNKWTTVFISSLAIAFQYMALAATSLGLGSQWVSSVNLPKVSKQIKKLLGIPEEFLIYDMLVVGYPDMEPTGKKIRPREEIIHYNDCGKTDFRTEEEVRAYFGK
jgi:nitroreductase